MKTRVALAVALAALVFLYRFNTLGGSLGGFDNDHFINLARANQLLEGDWPLRDYPDASLQAAWPPVTYMASAGAQLLLGQSLLAEAVLTTITVAAAAALTMFAGARLTGNAWLGALAAVLSVLPSVKLYGSARPFLFALTSLLTYRYIDAPSTRRLAAVAASLTLAFLVRHDYAVYLACGVTAALLLQPGRLTGTSAVRWVTCGAISVALLIPTLLSVQWLVGLDAYVASARSLADDELARTNLRWPVLDPANAWTGENAVPWLYYTFLAVPAIGAVVALWRWARGRAAAGEPAKVLGTCAAAAAANQFLLRGNVEARLADSAVLVALIAVWLLTVACTAGSRGVAGRAWQAATAAVTIALIAVSTIALGAVGSVRSEINTARFTEGPLSTLAMTRRVWGIMAGLPPQEFGDEGEERDGEMLAAAYLSRCTPPDARVLNATYGTEFLVFARRGFAAGHVNFVPGFYSTPVEQMAAVARATRENVPVAVTDPLETYEEDFVPDFPLVDQFLRERYAEAGTIEKDGEPYLRVLVERGKPALGTFRDTGLPCFR